MISVKKSLLFFTFIILNISLTLSHEIVTLSDISSSGSLQLDGQFIELYLDVNDSFNIEKDYNNSSLEFTPLNQNTFGLLDQRHDIWLRFTLGKEDVKSNKEWILSGWPDGFKITLYSPNNINGIDNGTTWEEIPVFRTGYLEPSLDNDKTYYLKVGERPGWFTGIYINSLDSYISSFKPEILGFGIFYGILIAIVIYNFMLFFVIKDKVYLYYIGYLVGMTSFFLRQNGFLYLMFPTFSTFQLYSIGFVLMVVGVIFAIKFSVSFLNIHDIKLKRIALILQLIWCAIIVLYFVLPHHITSRVDAFGGILTVLVLLYFVIIRARQKYRYAIFYAVSWGILGLSEVLHILTVYRVLPINKLTTVSFQIGSLFELIFLSFALGYRIKQLQDSMNTYKKGEEYLKKINSLDPLTGLLNRRNFEDIIDAVTHNSNTQGVKYSVLFMDIDNFKSINDVYGHSFGDKVIKNVAKVIKDSLRVSDQPFRYGGEEFVVILPDTKIYEAKKLGERIRKEIESVELVTEMNKIVQFTISVGVAESKYNHTGHDTIKKSDKALYSAKNSGKNKVVIAIS